MKSPRRFARLKFAVFCTVAALFGSCTRHAVAKDYFLTIGGGYSVTGNQLSLERNVVFQQAVLAAQRPDQPRHDVFFADGSDPNPDLQCRDPQFQETCPAARRIMAKLFSEADQVDLVYRNHEIANLTGPAELSLVKRRMREIAREIKPQDRLIVYVTGHGGEAEKQYDDHYDYEYDEESETWKANSKEVSETESEYNRYNTSFYLWDSDTVSASEFAAWLDRLPRQTQVVLVMVQCFSGGFAHTIFQQADADLGLSAHARCGFFAQLHDRGAAGCTPDANEADYEEYSSYFWGAMGGKTRTGEAITSADYNGDGQISFAEAHAYAMIESNTIDVPVRTSDALLQKFSSLRKEPKEKNDENNPLGRVLGFFGGERTSRGAEELMDAAGPLAKLIEVARPDQQAILTQLPAKFGLGDTPTVEVVKQRLGQVESKVNVASAKLATAVTTHSTTLERVQEEVRELWPELHNDNSPLSMALTSERAEEFVSKVTSMGSYQALAAAEERVDEFSQEQLQLSRDEARLQRLVKTCEAVALAANLPRIAPPDIVERYQQLVAMEESTLAASAVSQSAELAGQGVDK